MNTRTRTLRLPYGPQGLLARGLSIIVLLSMVLGLSACASIEPSAYQAEKPVLDLRTYFNGPVQASGMFQDRSGKVIRRFTVQMVGRWEGDTGVLQEDFSYSDGSHQQRIWTIRQKAPGHYVGTAPDVVGEAQGVAAGNALNWHYTMALEVDGRVWHVDFDDWMFLIDDHVMLNRAVMSKFGIRLGEVTLAFSRP
jgi:Protein of unknown function (DUF3833)